MCYKCQGRGHVQRDCPNNKRILYSSQACYESFDEGPRFDDYGDDAALEAPLDNTLEGLDHEDAYTCAPLGASVGVPLSLVTRRVLTVKETDLADQRENLFHTRCLVLNTSLSIIVDGGSCCNIINEKVVKHLNLPTTLHPQPYGLQWITDGRPWQFDRKVIHDGFLNTYLFTHNGKRITLLPMSPKEILEDQVERSRAKAIASAKSPPPPSAAASRTPRPSGPRAHRQLLTRHRDLAPVLGGRGPCFLLVPKHGVASPTDAALEISHKFPISILHTTEDPRVNCSSASLLKCELTLPAVATTTVLSCFSRTSPSS